MGLSLGKVVKADSHIHYLCQIYGRHEVKADSVPQPHHYALGNFVQIGLGGENGLIIGLIYDTMLLNPDFGNLGPRLSPEHELKIFAPDYLNERAVLVRIAAVGHVAPSGEIFQGVPRLAASSDAEVREMSPAQIREFHRGSDGGLHLAYLPVLLRQTDPLIYDMVQMMLGQLAGLLSEAQRAELDVISDELLWRTQIGPLGGTQ